MSVRRAKEIGGKPKSIKLTDALTNLNSAFIKTKVRMDEISSEESMQYSKTEILSSLSLPFFSLSEVTIKLNFAIQDMVNNEMYVLIDSTSLEKLPPHIISQVDIKLSPLSIKTYKSKEGTIVTNE